MALRGRVRESAAATKTFGMLRIERRILTTPTRTIAIGSIATISVGTNVASRPRGLYWLAAAVFAVMAFGSMRPDFTVGPVTPTPFTVLLGGLVLVFAGLALRPDDKTHYLLISSNDGVLSRFTASDRYFLEEARQVLNDRINSGDEQLALSINFEKPQIETLSASDVRPSHYPIASDGAAPGYQSGGSQPAERPGSQVKSPARPSVAATPRSAGRAASRSASTPSPQPPVNGAAATSAATSEIFINYAPVLPSIVEMHRFYARQPGTQHLEQRLSELELLMRSGTPTTTQKSRVKELSAEMSQILQAYPQAVELFDHVAGLVA